MLKSDDTLVTEYRSSIDGVLRILRANLIHHSATTDQNIAQYKPDASKTL